MARMNLRAYEAAKQKELDELVARNRKYMIEVLGGRPVKSRDWRNYKSTCSCWQSGSTANTS